MKDDNMTSVFVRLTKEEKLQWIKAAQPSKLNDWIHKVIQKELTDNNPNDILKPPE